MSRSLNWLLIATLPLGCSGRTGHRSSAGEGEAEAEAEEEVDGSALDASPWDAAAPDGPHDESMILVPTGAFWMGCNEAVDADCRPDEYPYREVTLSAFLIDRTEVTVEAYTACVAAGACQIPGRSPPHCTWDIEDGWLYPVDCVSWFDARDYCAWARKRLPTEAEWEKAARGTDGRLYPWGNSPPSCSLVVSMHCPGYPQPVGTHPDGASPYGAMDMAGNVSEWVADWYQEDYYASAPANDPRGPTTGTERIWRGGSAWAYSLTLRTSYRRAVSPGTPDGIVGFRCASDP